MSFFYSDDVSTERGSEWSSQSPLDKGSFRQSRLVHSYTLYLCIVVIIRSSMHPRCWYSLSLVKAWRNVHDINTRSMLFLKKNRDPSHTGFQHQSVMSQIVRVVACTTISVALVMWIYSFKLIQWLKRNNHLVSFKNMQFSKENMLKILRSENYWCYIRNILQFKENGKQAMYFLILWRFFRRNFLRNP